MLTHVSPENLGHVCQTRSVHFGPADPLLRRICGILYIIMSHFFGIGSIAFIRISKISTTSKKERNISLSKFHSCALKKKKKKKGGEVRFLTPGTWEGLGPCYGPQTVERPGLQRPQKGPLSWTPASWIRAHPGSLLGDETRGPAVPTALADQRPRSRRPRSRDLD